MLVCFTFHQGDKAQAQRLAAHIAAIGGVQKHSCLIVHPQETNTDGIIEPLREAFAAVDELPYRATLSGWPYGPNELAVTAMQFIANNPAITSHWLLLEPDCVPLPGWLDALDLAYQRCGRPLLGVVNDTIELDTGHSAGRHTVGVAVYPKQFPQLCRTVKSAIAMTSEYARAKAMPKAFDAYFGPYTAPNTAETKLIDHKWRSHSYRMENGLMLCECEPSGANNVVNPETVLIHGCKDSSLLNLIQQNHSEKPSHAKTSQKTSSQATQSHRQEGVPERRDGRREEPAQAERPQGSPVAGAVAPSEPPFPKGSPEHKRRCQLALLPFVKLRNYATKNLRVKVYGKKIPEIINAVVLAERAEGKEEWTDVFKPTKEPDAASETNSSTPFTAGWSPTEPSTDGGMSPAMRDKIMELRRARNMPVEATA